MAPFSLVTILFISQSAHAGNFYVGQRVARRYPVSNYEVGPIQASMSLSSAPAWFQVLPASQLGPATIPSRGTANFQVEYRIGPSFMPGQRLDIPIQFTYASLDGKKITHQFCHLLSNDGGVHERWTCTDDSGRVTSDTRFPDTTPPTTSRYFYMKPYVDHSSRTFTTTISAIMLEASDPRSSDAETSGVDKTFFSIDADTPTTPYVKPITLSEGTHTLRYRSVDRTGNLEAIQSLQIFVDGTPPVSSLKVEGSTFSTSNETLTTDTHARIVLSAVDHVSSGVTSGVSRILVYVDDALPFESKGPFTIPQGVHKMTYFAIDNVENTEAPHNLKAFIGVPAEKQP